MTRDEAYAAVPERARLGRAHGRAQRRLLHDHRDVEGEDSIRAGLRLRRQAGRGGPPVGAATPSRRGRPSYPSPHEAACRRGDGFRRARRRGMRLADARAIRCTPKLGAGPGRDKVAMLHGPIQTVDGQDVSRARARRSSCCPAVTSSRCNGTSARERPTAPGRRTSARGDRLRDAARAHLRDQH